MANQREMECFAGARALILALAICGLATGCYGKGARRSSSARKLSTYFHVGSKSTTTTTTTSTTTPRATTSTTVIRATTTVRATTTTSTTTATTTTMPASGQVCGAMTGYRDRQDLDAAEPLRACLQRTSAGMTMEIPAGTYWMHTQLVVDRAVTIRTQGKDLSQPKCDVSGSGCAELRADASLFERFGMLNLVAEGIKIDHLVLNGNKDARMTSAAADQCRGLDGSGTNQYGYNGIIQASGIEVTNSVTKNALCGTGMQVTTVSRLRFVGNTVALNGYHDRDNLWSDGLTVGSVTDSVVENNEIYDNSDVDLIFGGCRNCSIHGNSISHRGGFGSSSFAAFMLYAWPNSSGDYTGTDVSGNSIDCGSKRYCGFGIYIGSDAWSVPNYQLFGGAVHGNPTRNAQTGFNVDHLTGPMAIYDVDVQNCGGISYATSCGTRVGAAYNIEPGSIAYANPNQSNFTRDQWDGCTPNWWKSPY